MKQGLLLIGVLILIASCNNISTKIDNRKLAFQNDEFISCYNFSTGETANLTEGFDPCISPDGEWIAYTESGVIDNDGSRVIKLISTKDSLKKELNINNSNHYGAIWSPIGDYLAFSIMLNHWYIGVIKPNSSDYITLMPDSETDLYSPTWTQDGEFILAHNMSTLYKFNINGNLIQKYNILELVGLQFFFSSSTKFFMASDNETLIFDSGVDEYIEGLNGPSSAIFSYNLTTKSIERISKKGICTMDLWIDKQDMIYFSGLGNANEPSKIYQTSLTDTTAIVIINKGMNPSIGFEI